MEFSYPTPQHTDWRTRINPLVYDLLHSLQDPGLDGRCSEPLLELHIRIMPDYSRTPTMPVAGFINLRRLTVWQSGVPSTLQPWLQQLGSLQHLQDLDLTLQDADSPSQLKHQLQLPALPALARLHLFSLVFKCTLRICLASVPQLSHLEVSGYGTVDLAGDQGHIAHQAGLVAGSSGGSGGGCSGGSGGNGSSGGGSCRSAGKLVWAKLAGTHLIADFALMRALAHLEVTVQVRELDGAASIAAASALTQLRLFDSYALPDYERATWPMELLRSLPPSLRALSVPSWSSELAEAVGGLTQLHALSVAYHGEEPKIPPPEAPLWPSLRALHIPANAVPQELRHASRLQLLSFRDSQLSADVISLLATLPALRHVRYEASASCSQGEATRQAVQRAVPWLQSICIGDLGAEAFFSEALALLG
ncbi:hypothetical protein N2152v2_004372 [Parachlorella kessleri]